MGRGCVRRAFWGCTRRRESGVAREGSTQLVVWSRVSVSAGRAEGRFVRFRIQVIGSQQVRARVVGQRPFCWTVRGPFLGGCAYSTYQWDGAHLLAPGVGVKFFCRSSPVCLPPGMSVLRVNPPIPLVDTQRRSKGAKRPLGLAQARPPARQVRIPQECEPCHGPSCAPGSQPDD